MIVIRDNPRPKSQFLTCLSRAAFHGQAADVACANDRRVVVDETVFAAERTALHTRADTYIVDFTDWFCSETDCPGYKDGTVVYRDGNHLSIAAVLALKSALESEMVEILESARTQ